MAKLGVIATVLIVMFGMVQSVTSQGPTDKKEGPQLAHMVYFSLKDNSPGEVQKVVDACNKYLTKHDGVVFFAVGTLAKELKREVNDRDFDVAVHLVFANKEADDKYSASERHQQFVKEMEGKFKKVRVFDAYVRK